MDATLYTGTGSSQSIVNSGGFKPDLVWTKSRSNAISHHLTDSVRGADKALYSNATFHFFPPGPPSQRNERGRGRGDPPGRVPAAHLRLLQDLELMVTLGDYAFVHAGVRPGIALDDQDEKDLRWIRGDFIDSAADFGAVVVHGHTIRDEVEERANRIGIDTGAYASGRLTAIGLEGTDRWYLST